jgi:hypothetical protein
VHVLARDRGHPPAWLGPLGDGAVDRAQVEGWRDGLARRGFALDGAVRPGDLGALHEAMLTGEHRHRRGVHYTPAPLAALLVDVALEVRRSADGTGTVGAPSVVLDPSCGAGAFLVAAAEALHRDGLPAAEVLARLHGLEVDLHAAGLTVAVVRAWAVAHGWHPEGDDGAGPRSGPHVRIADALDPSATWRTRLGPPDLVAGNPPFAGQLSKGTARPAVQRRRADAALGAAAGYADGASLFLTRACTEVAPGGAVVLVQPASLLAARDTTSVRRALEPWLAALWVGEGGEFDAGVQVCAPVVVAPDASAEAEPGRSSAPSATAAGRPGDPRGVRVLCGPDGSDRTRVDRSRLRSTGSWAPLWAAAVGVPDVELDTARRLGSWCSATAGFRDEFYALAPLVTDDPAPCPSEPPEPGQVRVLTSGLVDPAGTGWGVRSARLAGRRLDAPVLHLAAAASSPEKRLRAAMTVRSRPKVVLATQSRVLEAVVDDDGRWWPSVPLITVLLRDELDDVDHRWMVAAALMAPPVTAWALCVAGGTALTPTAVKLAARQVLDVPLPVDDDLWRRAATALRGASRAASTGPDLDALTAVGTTMCDAYGLDRDAGAHVTAWWRARLER